MKQDEVLFETYDEWCAFMRNLILTVRTKKQTQEVMKNRTDEIE